MCCLGPWHAALVTSVMVACVQDPAHNLVRMVKPVGVLTHLELREHTVYCSVLSRSFPWVRG